MVLIFLAASPVLAQRRLVDSTPSPNAVLSETPTQLTLEFSERIRALGIEVTLVNNQQQIPVELSTPFIEIGRILSYEIEGEILPGEYTVAYRVLTDSSPEPIRGTFLFSYVPPRPQLMVDAPVDGQTFDTGDITVAFRTEFFELNAPERAVNIYVNEEFIASVDETSYQVTGLEPGVHEIRVRLDQDGNAISESEHVLTVAVRRDAEENPPLTERQTPVVPIIVGGLLSAMLLTFGAWLGRNVSA